MTDHARKAILWRIREALRTKTASRYAEAGGEGDETRLPDAVAMRAALPAAGSSRDAMIEAFAERSIALKTRFEMFETYADLGTFLCDLAREEQWTMCAAHQMPMIGNASDDQDASEAWHRQLGVPVLLTDDGYDINVLEACDASITACDALIAQTGSVLVTARSAGGRALSVLPPHHVVVATTDQLLPDLPAGYELLQRKYSTGYPSWMGLITGPSRTADIERILVLGAHGPKKLTVCLVRTEQ